MILKASQRGGGKQLAAHLLNARDNDHVTVHELRGFVAGNLTGALNEAYAVSRGTRCRQFLFSLSLSPPKTEDVPSDMFERAIADIEAKMKLSGHPRAIVFHEKHGRRHAHCVWSRIDTDSMTAINLPHFKLKLRDMSRSLFLENDWQMPRGLMNSEGTRPLHVQSRRMAAGTACQARPARDEGTVSGMLGCLGRSALVPERAQGARFRSRQGRSPRVCRHRLARRGLLLVTMDRAKEQGASS
ncbi:relaxase/mobilization nuclease domain-containing protein [Oceaniradius stylonematis]|uniref:relaxase/mobilization nuclease domain-containing protein n=1 Tax=Oceaniradius stylonematis TaxID=2184161 RepID=UPI0035D136D8